MVLVSNGTMNSALDESCKVPLFNHGWSLLSLIPSKGLESSHLQLFGEPRFPVCQRENSSLEIHLEARRLDVINRGSSCVSLFLSQSGMSDSKVILDEQSYFCECFKMKTRFYEV